MAVAVFLLTLLPYLQTVSFDFVNYDDTLYVTKNPHVQKGLCAESLRWVFSAEPVRQIANWHPLTFLSLMADVSLFGESPGAIHLHNALLHALDAVLLFLFLAMVLKRLETDGVSADPFARASEPARCGLLGRDGSPLPSAHSDDRLAYSAPVACAAGRTAGAAVPTGESADGKGLPSLPVDLRLLTAAALAALFWSLHPLRVESVAWVSSRKDVLCIFFLLLGLMSYLRNVGGGGKSFLFASGACFFFAYASKPTAVVYPLLAVMLEYLVTRKVSWRRNELLVYLMAVFCMITYLAQHMGHAAVSGLALTQRLSNAIASVGQYVTTTLLPVNLAIFYKYEIPVPYTRLVPGALFLLAVFHFFLNHVFPIIREQWSASRARGRDGSPLPSAGPCGRDGGHASRACGQADGVSDRRTAGGCRPYRVSADPFTRASEPARCGLPGRDGSPLPSAGQVAIPGTAGEAQSGRDGSSLPSAHSDDRDVGSERVVCAVERTAGAAVPTGESADGKGLPSLPESTRVYAVGILWFGVALGPVVGLVQVGFASCADRYTYLPAIGLSLALAYAVSRALAGAAWLRASALGALSALLLALLALTYRQTGFWKDTRTLFLHATQVTRENYVAYCNLGTYSLDRGNYEEAFDYNLESVKALLSELERKTIIIGYKDQMINNLGIVLAVLGGAELKRGVGGVSVENYNVFEYPVKKDDPKAADRYFALGLMAYHKELNGLAEQHLRTACELKPADCYRWRFLGFLLERQARFEEAITAYDKSQSLESDATIRERLRRLKGRGGG